MQKNFEAAFIERLKKGERKVMEEWYDRTAPALLAISMRYADSAEEAEDILHNAMMKMIKALPSFKYAGEGRFEAWMKKVLVNTALLQLRDKAKLNQRSINGYELLQATDEYLADEDEEPCFRPEPDLLIEWIQQLPAGYRTVLNLYVFEEYTHKEIAFEMGISENTSKSQLSKARAFLRRKANELQPELQRMKNG